LLGGTAEPLVIKDRKGSICIATVKTQSLDYSLYYVPVEPIARLLREGKKKHVVLLLGIYSYLYRVLQLPWYTESDTYLYSCYDCLESILLDDQRGWIDEDDYLQYRSEFRSAKYWGKRIVKSLRHPYALDNLGKHLNNFKPRGAEDEQLQTLCNTVLRLNREYPGRSIFRNLPEKFLYPDAEDSEHIKGYQWLSFYWSGEGYVYNNLMEHINYEFQETVSADEPLAIQVFNKPQAMQQHDLLFPQQVFELLASLCDYLY